MMNNYLIDKTWISLKKFTERYSIPRSNAFLLITGITILVCPADLLNKMENSPMMKNHIDWERDNGNSG